MKKVPLATYVNISTHKVWKVTCPWFIFWLYHHGCRISADHFLIINILVCAFLEKSITVMVDGNILFKKLKTKWMQRNFFFLNILPICNQAHYLASMHLIILSTRIMNIWYPTVLFVKAIYRAIFHKIIMNVSLTVMVGKRREFSNTIYIV